MPGPLTYAAIALLAHDRIGQIKRALLAKKQAGNAKELDLHILYLATEAEKMMTLSQPVIEPPVRLYGPPLTVSRFMMLGAIGPDLPRYAAYFAQGQRWVFDTLHKGTPDEHRELVLTHSTDLVFDFYKRALPYIDADISDPLERTAARAQMRAYVMGHLSHIAADVLSHPYFESIEARLAANAGTPAEIRYMSRDDVAGAFDARIAKDFFATGSAETKNKSWADWFPTPGDVPAAFSKAMVDSIVGYHGGRAVGLPLFEEQFGALDPLPPELTPALMDEALSYFRTIMEIERVWTLADWLGATAAMFLPIGFAYFGALVLPLGKDLDKTLTAADGEDAEARRTFQAITYPLAVSSLGPLVTMIIVSASGRALGPEGITGWIQAGYSLVATIGFFASLGSVGAAHWTFWFAIPLVLAVAQIIFVLVRGARENSRKLLFLGPLVQILLALFFMLLYHVWLHDGVEELDKPAAERDDLSAFGNFAAWLAIVVALWFIHALLWRYVFSSSVAEDQDLFNPEPRQFLRLYDDMALIHDFEKPATSENLRDLAYPPGRREMLKLWWEPVGASEMKVLIKHDRLEFESPTNAALDRVVFAPLGATTIEKWAELLAAVVSGDGAAGHLRTKPARDDEKKIELAPGLLFSDSGDDKTTQLDHDAGLITKKTLAATEADALILFHTVRPRLAVRMGRTGAAPEGKREAQDSKPDSLLQSDAANPRHYFATPGSVGTSALLRRLFVPGDVIEIASTAAPINEQRIVEEVLNDAEIIVSSPFVTAVPTPAPNAGIAYKRVASDRSAPLTGAAPVRNPAPALGIGPNDIEGVGILARFGSQFMAGDVVEFQIPGLTQPERRRIVAVKDNPGAAPPPNLLELDSAPPVFAGTVPLVRVADSEADGFPYFARPADVFGDSESVMNDAADLATLLCLGAASRLTENDTPVPPAPDMKPVHRVYQVFRNWNLDRRRVNEWKLMVSGGAASERQGDFRSAEEAAPVSTPDVGETFSDAFIEQRKKADEIVRRHGWLGVFRGWVDMASRQRTDTTSTEVFRPGMPSNRDLSRAMAHLIDATEGVTP